MTAIYHVDDADPRCIAGSRIAVVGYGDAGAAWARNLRDGDHEVVVCTRPGPSAERAAIDGFTPRPLESAVDADVVCLLVPDGVVATLPFDPAGWALTIATSGRALAAGRFAPNGDVGLVVPKAPPAEVRRRFLSGEGVASAVGVHHDRTGGARSRLLALAHGIGALGQGAIEVTATQEALLSLAVEQVADPGLAGTTTLVLQAMVDRGIPLEAVISALVIGGDLPDPGRATRAAICGEDPWGGDGPGDARDVAPSGAGRLGVGRIGAGLRRAVDDLVSGRPERRVADADLVAFLAPFGLSPDDLRDDLRARVAPAAS